MKLFVAAADGRRLRMLLPFALLAALLLAAPSLAEDLDYAEEGVIEPAVGAVDRTCPELIQVKYPGLSCVNGQIGQSDADETWENSRQIPRMSDWTESNGTWGPELNRD